MSNLDLIKRFQHISYYFNQQNFAQVVALFRPPLSPSNVPVELALMYAISLRRVGQLEASKNSFSTALKAYPQHGGLRNSFGNLLLELGLAQLALEQFEQVIKLEPNNADGYLNSARALSKLERFEQAVIYSHKAHAIKPGDINIAIALAENLKSADDVLAAEAMYSSLLQQHPDNIKVLNNLGNLKRQSGEISEAIRLLAQAAVSNNGTVFRNLAACYALNNDFTLAYHNYQQAMRASPDDVEAYTEYAALLWQQGDATPFAHIEHRLATCASHHALVIEYIKILLKLQTAEKAEQYLRPLLEQFPNDSSVLILATMVYRDKGDFARAEAYGRKALNCATSSDVIAARSELGYTLLARQQGTQARELYQQLCLDDPYNQGWWTTLSSALKQCGEMQQYNWLCNYALVYVRDLTTASAVGSLPSDFNQKLLPLLNQLHRNIRAPLGLSLQKGSQTFENLFERHEPLLAQLQHAIVLQAKAFIATLGSDKQHPFLSRLSESLKFQGSWSVQLRDEGFHKSHYHPMGWLSGVYYVDIPDAVAHDGQGWLVFGRPDIPNVDEVGDYAVKPQPGMLVLFPSFMWHGTNPFKSATNRVTVAFDLVPG